MLLFFTTNMVAMTSPANQPLRPLKDYENMVVARRFSNEKRQENMAVLTEYWGSGV